jgi:hypothetical protein
MSTETITLKNDAVTGSFPTQQSAILPGAGTGDGSLYLAGTPGASQIYIYFVTGGGNVQVFYGQDYSYPNTPLPQGTTTYPLANGFNIRWVSDGSPFKLVWGAQ